MTAVRSNHEDRVARPARPSGVELSTVIPLPTGLITVPGPQAEKYPGLQVIAPYVVCAYLVQTPDSTLLFDTGINTDQGGIDWYRPKVFSILHQLGAHGVERSDIDVIVNCHMHCDHAGGNYLFPGVPAVGSIASEAWHITAHHPLASKWLLI